MTRCRRLSAAAACICTPEAFDDDLMTSVTGAGALVAPARSYPSAEYADEKAQELRGTTWLQFGTAGVFQCKAVGYLLW